MSLLAVMAGVVLASPGAPLAQPLEPEPPAPALALPGSTAEVPGALLRFDELPAPAPPPADDQRVKRFLGALAGGAVGFAAPLAMLPLGDPGCGFGFCTVAGAHLALAAVAPVTGALGAWLGFLIAGGDAGPLTGLASLLPGALIALSMFAVATATQQGETVQRLMPFLLTAGAGFVGGAALSLDARERQLAGLGGARSWGSAAPGRVVLTTLVTAVAGTAGALGTIALAFACRDTACGVLAAGGLGLSTLLGTAAAAWGVHRALGGRGGLSAALLALGLVGGASLVALPLLLGASTGFPGNMLTGPAAGVVAVQLAIGGALFFPTLALEWSHADAVGALATTLSFSAAPVPGGGQVAAALRF